MARFDSAYAAMGLGGSFRTNLESMGRLLLARAIASGDVRGTVETFRSYIERNSAPIIAVMAVSGVRTAKEVRLGPDIQLVPMASLPASMQRGEALGQSHFHPLAIRSRILCALVISLDFAPVFYLAGEEGSAAKQQQMQERVVKAFGDLNEARRLFTLLGINTANRMSWIQPEDPLMSTGLNTGVLVNDESFIRTPIEVDAMAIEALAGAYFQIDQRRRHSTLGIPLDWLDRCSSEFDLANRSIDLGIALEALLLHDMDKEDRGELRFRLSLRGAWLIGNNEAERANIRTTLMKVYDLRSRAVRTGLVEQNHKNS